MEFEIKENEITFEKTPFYKDYKANHKFTEEFKRQLDKSNPPGTRIEDTITGEVYITKGSN